MLALVAAVAHAAILLGIAVWSGALDGPTGLLIALIAAWTAAEAWVQHDTDTTSDTPSTVLGWALLATFIAAVSERGDGLWVGAIPLVAGICLRVAAVHTLGSAFITAPSSSGEPVSTGLYRWMRHPSEVGNLLISTGAVWMSGSLVAAALALFGVLPLVLWRVHREDAWWLAHGSPAHQEHVRRVPAFIPGRRLP